MAASLPHKFSRTAENLTGLTFVHNTQMDIADKFAEILVALTKYRFMPTLKNMSDASIFAIIILAVPGQNTLHYPPTDKWSSPE